MSTFFLIMMILFFIVFSVFMIVLLIQILRNKPLKKVLFVIFGSCICILISTILCFATICKHELIIIDEVSSTCLQEGKIIYQCTKCEKTAKKILPVLEHEWKEADCNNPKMCHLCGITEGDKVEHQWITATCIVAKTCSLCGLEDGTPMSEQLTHTWKEATCTEPQTCIVCKETEGTTIEHSLGEWNVIDEGTLDTEGTRQQKCTVCLNIINTEKFDSPSKIVADVIKDIVNKHNGLISDLDVLSENEDSYLVATSAICCENSEKVVKQILSDMSDAFKKYDYKIEGIFAFGDINDGLDGNCLAMGSITSDGNYTVTSMSVDFNTERNNWITSQFSVWDGSHTVLKELIKDNLNDESSFKHIETTYIDISSEDMKNNVNGILEDSGYSNRVDIGDLFLMTEFSAKNAFNATVKNTAFGIVDYSENVVTLIGIE